MASELLFIHISESALFFSEGMNTARSFKSNLITSSLSIPNLFFISISAAPFVHTIFFCHSNIYLT